MDKNIGKQTEITFPPFTEPEVDPKSETILNKPASHTSQSEVVGEAEIQKIKENNFLKDEISPLLIEFFKGKENKGFNARTVYQCYKKSHDAYEKESIIKSKNPNYTRTSWDKLMANNRPDSFTPEEWLKFVGKYHVFLTKTIVDYEKLKIGE